MPIKRWYGAADAGEARPAFRAMRRFSTVLLMLLEIGLVGAAAAVAEPPTIIDLETLIESRGDGNDDHVVGEDMC